MTAYYCEHHNKFHDERDFKGYMCPDHIYYSCKDDLVTFGQFFLPGDFRKKFKSPHFHRVVGNRMISNDFGLHLALIAWRDAAKSMLAKAALLNLLGYRKRESTEYVVWLCETEDQAVDHIKYLQRNLEANPAFKYYFGDYYGKGDWTKRGFETGRGDLFRPLGMTQKPRGRAHFVDWQEGSTRLTRLILDDFESENNTKTPERRQYNKAFISGALMPTLDKTPGKEGVVWLLGTLVAHDTYLADLWSEWQSLDEEERKGFWEVHRFPATLDGTLDDDAVPTWPDKFPLEELRIIKKRDFFMAPSQFWIEYMQNLDNDEDNDLAIANIQYHNGRIETIGKQHYLVWNNEAIPVYIYIGGDLAGIGISKHHDYHSFVVLAVDSARNYYILEIFNEHMPVFDTVPVLLRLAEKYSPVQRVNVEKAASGEMVRAVTADKALKSLSALPGMFEGIPVSPAITKKDRLNTFFGPLLRDQRLYVMRKHDIIGNQLRGSKHDDVLDATYYAGYYADRLFPTSERFPEKQLGRKHNSTFLPQQNVASWKRSLWDRYNWVTGKRTF